MTSDTLAPRAVFMLGGPGAGKSYVRRRRFADLLVLDCDKIKRGHPEYDPMFPGRLHEWSKQEVMGRFQAALAARQEFVYDGTGSTAERYVAYMRMAQARGYKVTVCYVRVSLATALLRNATRERTVPESIVRDKHSLIATSYEIVSAIADEMIVVNNEVEVKPK